MKKGFPDIDGHPLCSSDSVSVWLFKLCTQATCLSAPLTEPVSAVSSRKLLLISEKALYKS